MNRDMLKPIDDSALESVSGGHGIIGHIAEHVIDHVEHVVDFVGDAAGSALLRASRVLGKIGGALKD
jgi:hypothetical protein